MAYRALRVETANQSGIKAEEGKSKRWSDEKNWRKITIKMRQKRLQLDSSTRRGLLRALNSILQGFLPSDRGGEVAKYAATDSSG